MTENAVEMLTTKETAGFFRRGVQWVLTNRDLVTWGGGAGGRIKLYPRVCLRAYILGQLANESGAVLRKRQLEALALAWGPQGNREGAKTQSENLTTETRSSTESTEQTA